MVNGMANGETTAVNLGEGVVVCLGGLISWMFTPVLGERGAIVKGECHFFFGD